MRKHIYKLIIVILLMIDPTHFTSSNEVVMTKDMSLEDYVIQAKKIKQTTIENAIIDKYNLFYNNLDTIDRPDFTKEFIVSLLCDAIDGKSLPSISISQAALETGYGRYRKLKNNLFGIKGRGIKSKTKEYINGRYIIIYAEFQIFKTQKHAFNRHFEIINNYGVSGDNYQDWINTIVLNGYATDPNYGKKLDYIINKYRLNLLDEIQKLNNELKNIDNEFDISRIQEEIQKYIIYIK